MLQNGVNKKHEESHQREIIHDKLHNDTITFFGRKLCKVHKKDTVLHVTITFSQKQWETRTSSGPILYRDTLPLRVCHVIKK